VLPSTKFTGGLRITWSPTLRPVSTSTRVPKSRVTLTLRISALPPLSTATCSPLRLKMIASAGTTKDGVVRGILSSTAD
jgi:hypothetical protein